ncbi:putative F-box/LRR-repeat protein 23 [Bidens hawaiensis]|uniref:putative F-box/LRR-repeat protein 23 n=1 Tax=Bidens hawaiensis TaxID=980011 RepID=UPI00404B3A04
MSPRSKLKKIFKFVRKLKQPWLERKRTRNWLDLPSDLTINILQRVGVVDIVQNAQIVCTAWRDICKDPAMWRVVYLNTWPWPCKSERELLQYVVDRSSQLRRLEIMLWYGVIEIEPLKRLSLLEELSLYRVYITQENIETLGHYCPLLKTLKVSNKPYKVPSEDDVVALTIGKNLPGLTHLELIGNRMTNIGLEAILDGCCHLESLDLRVCWFLDMIGDLGERCSEQVKHLKLPYDPFYF